MSDTLSNINLEFKIRPATESDFIAVLEILQSCGLPAKGVKDFFGEAYCVAETNTGIVGVGGLETYGDCGLIRSLSVLPMWRWKLIGRNIVINRIARARDLDLRKVYLFTFDRTDYFDHFGFAEIKRDDLPEEIKNCEEYKSICPSGAFSMELTL